MLQIGPYEIHLIESGRFRLDGGAMFGVVPKVLWSEQKAPDELNRIPMTMRVALAIDRTAGRVLLVDSGAGGKWDDRELERFAMEVQGDPLGRALQRLGLGDDDITDVIVTHLHFDHNSGLTYWKDAAKERALPRFRRARHWIHRRHLEYARSPTVKDRASFHTRDFEPIERAGLFEYLEGEQPDAPFDHISWFVAHGHTPFMLLPRFFDDQRSALFVSDLIPTCAHLPLPWIMAFDNEPLKTLREKERVLKDCADQDLILLFEHDADVPAARIDITGKKPQIREVFE